MIFNTDRFWISPYSFSTFLSLTEKNLKFEVREIALDKEEQKSEHYQKNSFTGRVPSIDDDGFWLAESSAIAEYIDEKYPAPQYPSLFPRDLKERARARMVMAWLRSDLATLRVERSTTTMFYQPTGKPLSSLAQMDAEKLNKTAALLISGKPNIFGDNWCLADSELAFMIHRLILSNDHVDAEVRKYAQTQWQRPSIQKFIDRKRPEYCPF